MKKIFFCTAIIVSFLSSCSLIGLEKVAREDLGLSPQSISVPQSGGTYTVTSRVPNFDLDAIRAIGQDGIIRNTQYERVFDEDKKEVIGLDSEWISVRKSVNEATNGCQLTIVVAENVTKGIRVCRVDVGRLDTAGHITIRQTQ